MSDSSFKPNLSSIPGGIISDVRESRKNSPLSLTVNYTVATPFLRAASAHGIRKPLPLMIAAQVEYFSSMGEKYSLTKSNKTLISELYPGIVGSDADRRDRAIEKSIGRLIKANILKSYSKATPSKKGKSRALVFHADFINTMSEFADETETVTLYPSINQWLELEGVESKTAFILLSHISTITSGRDCSWHYSKRQIERFGISKSNYSITIRQLVDLGAIYIASDTGYRIA